MNDAKEEVKWAQRSKTNLVLFFVIMLTAGLLVGIISDKAGAEVIETQTEEEIETEPDESLMVPCETTWDCDGWSVVEDKPMGKYKFKKGWLHRMPRDVNYSRGAKHRIIDALVPAWKRYPGPGPSTRAGIWASFVKHDPCGWRAVNGPGTYSKWTCKTPIPDVNVATKKELRGVVCTAVGGAALPAVFASTATGVGILGVGAAWAGCMWGEAFVRLGK